MNLPNRSPNKVATGDAILACLCLCALSLASVIIAALIENTPARVAGIALIRSWLGCVVMSFVIYVLSYRRAKRQERSSGQARGS
jgi:hypothetical protein